MAACNHIHEPPDLVQQILYWFDCPCLQGQFRAITSLCCLQAVASKLTKGCHFERKFLHMFLREYCAGGELVVCSNFEFPVK